MQKTVYNKKEAGPVKKLFISCALSLLLFPAVCLIFCAFLFGSEDPTGKLKLFSLVAFLISGAVGGILCARICRGSMKLKILSALISSFAFLLISLIASAGKLPVATLINLGIYLCISILFSSLERKKRKSYRRK